MTSHDDEELPALQRRELDEFLAMFPPGTPEQEAGSKAWAHKVIYGNESQL